MKRYEREAIKSANCDCADPRCEARREGFRAGYLKAREEAVKKCEHAEQISREDHEKSFSNVSLGAYNTAANLKACIRTMGEEEEKSCEAKGVEP